MGISADEATKLLAELRQAVLDADEERPGKRAVQTELRLVKRVFCLLTGREPTDEELEAILPF